MASVLVIDDDASHRALIEGVARSLQLTVEWRQADVFDASRIDQLRPAMAVLLGSSSDDLSWAALVKRMTHHHARFPVIAIAPHPAAAIEANRAGACDVLFKPLVAEELRDALCRIRRRLPNLFSLAVREQGNLTNASADRLIGRSVAMRQLCKAIGTAAASDVPVLIFGEAGVGKRTVARAIHDYCQNALEPLSEIECGSHTDFDVHPTLAADASRASKPHRRGSATSLPRSGTCLLASVDQLSDLAQRQLLRYLRTWQKDMAIDGDAEGVSPRVIATATVGERTRVARFPLLTELYYELGRFVITPPPLRERLDDVPLWAEHFLRYWSRRLGKRVYQLSPSAIELLTTHPWPGNLHELSSVVCQGVMCCQGTVLAADDVVQRIEPASAAASNSDDQAIMDWRLFVDERLAADNEGLYRAAMEAMDQRLLKLVLQRMEGNQARAAKALGMTRSRLRQKLRDSGIVIDHQIDVRRCL